MSVENKEIPRMVTGRRRSSRWTVVLREEVQEYHLRMRLANLVLSFMPRSCFNRLRTQVYRWCGVKIGAGTMILGPIELCGRRRPWQNLTIGEDCMITTPLFADLSAPINIGNRAGVGHHVVLITTDHDTAWPERRWGVGKTAPITIEDGAWVGAGCTLLPGVTIGRSSVVAAGAVVTADVPPDTLVGGVPARFIKKLPVPDND